MRLAVISSVLMALLVRPAYAQQDSTRPSTRATLSGVVTDSAGLPLANATVTIAALRLTAPADDRGEYRLTAIPLGTLLANVLGGFLMGLVIGSIDQFQTLPLEWRLALTTGFLGGLTTFSTFSGETLNHLLRQQWGWAGALVFVHVAGSILAALLGVVVIRAIVPQ